MCSATHPEPRTFNTELRSLGFELLQPQTALRGGRRLSNLRKHLSDERVQAGAFIAVKGSYRFKRLRIQCNTLELAVYVSLCVYMYIYTHTYIHIQIHIYIYIYIYILTYMNVCRHIWRLSGIRGSSSLHPRAPPTKILNNP